MTQNQLIEKIEKAHLKKKVPKFRIGDTVRVHLRIVEGNKERVQVFIGTVIAKKGKGVSETFSVYRHAYGSSMERVFLVHSPKIQKIEVVRSGKVRRAKLYYLRGAKGKAAKVRELLGRGPEEEALPMQDETALEKEPVAEEKVEEKGSEKPEEEKTAEKPDVDESKKRDKESFTEE